MAWVVNCVRTICFFYYIYNFIANDVQKNK